MITTTTYRLGIAIRLDREKQDGYRAIDPLLFVPV